MKNYKAESTNKRERKATGNGLQKTPVNGGIGRRESYHTPQMNEGNGTKGNRKEKTELWRNNMRKRWGRRWDSRKPRQQHPEMKHHLWCTGGKLLAESSPFDEVWGSAPRADDPDAHDPHLWRGKNLLGRALSTVRDLLRHNADVSAHPSSSPYFYTPILSEGIQINPAPLTRFRVSARACPGPPSEFSTHFSDAPADHSPDVLPVVSCAVSTLTDTPSFP